MIKRKLNDVLNGTQKIASKRDFTDQNQLRDKIKVWQSLSITDFCRKKPDFNTKHGLVYKLLKTSPSRLNDSTLCSHDVAFWLRDHKRPLEALWVIKLAGNKAGGVSRNQLLQWLRSQGQFTNMMHVYNWTKKWGFEDSSYTKTIICSPQTVDEARMIYRESKITNSASKQALSNKLLNELIKNTDKGSLEWADDVYKLFKTFNKDLITFQIMLGGMIKHNSLRKYCNQIWELAQRQSNSNNISIDTKLEETYNRVNRLIK